MSNSKKINVTNVDSRYHPFLQQLENDTLFVFSRQNRFENHFADFGPNSLTTQFYYSHSHIENAHFEPSDYDIESQEEYANKELTVCYCYDSEGNEVKFEYPPLVKPIYNPGEFPEDYIEAVHRYNIASKEWTTELLLKIRGKIEKSNRDLKEQPYAKLQVELDSIYRARLASTNTQKEQPLKTDADSKEDLAQSKTKKRVSDYRIETDSFQLINFFVANAEINNVKALDLVRKIQDQVMDNGYSIKWQAIYNSHINQSNPCRAIELIYARVENGDPVSPMIKIKIGNDDTAQLAAMVELPGLQMMCPGDSNGRYAAIDKVFPFKVDLVNALEKEPVKLVKKYRIFHDSNDECVTTLSSDAALLKFMDAYANQNAGITTAKEAIDYMAAHCPYLRLIDDEITETDILTKDTGLGAEDDYTLNKEGSIWISAKELSLNINMTDEGVKVTVYPKGDEFNHPIDELFVAHEDADLDDDDGPSM